MTELQNDRMTDRTKTICPPIFDLGGIKMTPHTTQQAKALIITTFNNTINM